MKKKVRLTESDLVNLIKKILKEQGEEDIKTGQFTPPSSQGGVSRETENLYKQKQEWTMAEDSLPKVGDIVNVMMNYKDENNKDVVSVKVLQIGNGSINVSSHSPEASKYGFKIGGAVHKLNPKSLTIEGFGDIVEINGKKTVNGVALLPKQKTNIIPKKPMTQPKTKTNLVKLLSRNDPKIVAMQIQPGFRVLPDGPDKWVIEAKTDRNKPIDLFFKCNPQGPEYTFIHSWEGIDGFKGRGQLIFDDQTLFGDYCRFKG